MKVADKRNIRKKFIHKREALTEEERRRLSEGVVRNLLSLEQLREAKTVLMFCPHRGEPDITLLFSWVIREGKSLLLPKVEGDGLKLIRVEEGVDLSPGAFCIPEPSGGEEVNPEEVDVSLVPGVAFDREGYRIGYGKGYYDRLLERLGGLKVGVCYQFQLLEEVPRDDWDMPVDLVVTEEKIYQGGKEI
ncbi:MAG: 5-formyltetrahydrofolate cyclo-ligase [Aquificaceae bacterium]|jgi:5-formyltetrahydrofolate cyclo-ligase|uniref:5-formyltetrahydrofolate cyclo-ligase n=1 Tax=Hydrogenobacter sp. Uz 6-8 TaxID=3384828 RepID=UPI000F113395|nr:MAG: 5-formyltetrahydrofolate cyclo-ligase [Aquificota bacterium]